MIRPAVLVLPLLVFGCAGDGTGPAVPPSPASQPPAFLDEDGGGRYVLTVGEQLPVRLPNEWVWTGPDVAGTGVEAVPVQARQDPGYVEWELWARAPGEVSITWRGEPNCAAPARCPPRTVAVTLEISARGVGGR